MEFIAIGLEDEEKETKAANDPDSGLGTTEQNVKTK